MSTPEPAGTERDDRACPICGGREFCAFKLGLEQCQRCDLVLSPLIWSPEANERLEEEWFGENYASRTSSWVEQFERWNNRRTLARIGSPDRPGQRLLEVGVGSGSFLAAARGQGYEVMGCDLSPAICADVEREHDLRVHCGPLATLTDCDRFDVIVMNHVLEHVHQPVEFLVEARRLLALDGRVHIAVPNIGSWEAGLAGWTSFQPYHLAYFAGPTLERSVVASGLNVEALTTHESFSGWFLTLLRTSLRMNRDGGVVAQPEGPGAGRPGGGRSGLVEHLYRLTMLLVGVVSWPLRGLQARLGRGDEVICLASSPNVPTDEGVA